MRDWRDLTRVKDAGCRFYRVSTVPASFGRTGCRCSRRTRSPTLPRWTTASPVCTGCRTSPSSARTRSALTAPDRAAHPRSSTSSWGASASREPGPTPRPAPPPGTPPPPGCPCIRAARSPPGAPPARRRAFQAARTRRCPSRLARRLRWTTRATPKSSLPTPTPPSSVWPCRPASSPKSLCPPSTTGSPRTSATTDTRSPAGR